MEEKEKFVVVVFASNNIGVQSIHGLFNNTHEADLWAFRYLEGKKLFLILPLGSMIFGD